MRCKKPTLYHPVLCLLFLFVFLVWSITGVFYFKVALGFLFIILVVQAAPGTRVAYRVIALFLFGLGAGGLVLARAGAEQWLTSLTNNGGLVAFFISIPLFSFMLSYQDYRGAIKGFFNRYIHSGAGLNVMAIWVSFILSSIINVASIPMLYDLLGQNALNGSARDDFYRSLVWGNVAGVFWAPNYVAVATVLLYTGLEWVNIMPAGVMLALLMMLLMTARFCLAGRKTALENASGHGGVKEFSWRPLVGLLLTYLGMIGLVAVMNIFTPFPILTIISLSAVIFPFGLAAVQNKMDVCRNELKNYFLATLPGIKNEILLFAAVGFFGKALEISGAGAYISAVLQNYRLPYPGLTALVLVWLMALLALVGVHPVVSISAFAAALDPAALGFSTLGYAYLLMFGYGIAVTISPFSGLSLVMAGTTRENPLYVVPGLNWRLCLFFSFLYAFLLPFIH